VMAASPTCKEHHDLSLAVWTRQEEDIAQLKSVLHSAINSMKYEGGDLTNIITNVVMPADVQTDVCNQDDIGQEKYIKFVEEHINKKEVSI